jgi:hypothetical protein
VTQLFDLNARIQQLTWSLIFYEKCSTSLSTIVLVVLTTANFGGFSNFYRYYARSQAGKSTGYRPTLKPLLRHYTKLSVKFPSHTLHYAECEIAFPHTTLNWVWNCFSTHYIELNVKLLSHTLPVIPKVPWTSLDIWSSKGRTFTGPNHFLLDQKKLTQFKCNILFSCIFIYVSPVFNFIMPIFT